MATTTLPPASQRFTLLRVSLPPGDAWTDQERLDWHGFSADGSLADHGACPAAELPVASELDLLLPACRISVHPLELPEHAGRHLDALIRQALEDRLLGDRTDALAIAGVAQGTQRRVWVCSRRWLEGALERLAAAGRQVARVVPEYELLPENDGETTFAAVAGGTILRTSAGQFGIVSNEAAVTQLAGRGTLRRIEDLDRQPCPTTRRAELPATLARFAGRRLDFRPWRRTGLLLAASAGLTLLAAIARWQYLENRLAGLQHEIRQTFAAAYPGTPIVDPILQWQSKQREAMQGQDDALEAAVRFAARLKLPLRPRGLEVSESGVRLTLTDSDAAQFKSSLEAMGHPDSLPAGPGFTQLSYRLGRETR